MDFINSLFKNKKVNPSKLTAFGFKLNEGVYVLEKVLSDCDFKLTISITEQGEITTKLIDPSFDEEYTLHLIDGAAGSFVGEIRQQYEDTLTDIADGCFEVDVFKGEQTKALIAHVKDTYGDETEYLWQRFPNNAIWRRKDTKKWYGALLTVSKRKLGMDCDELVEVVDLRICPDELKELVDGKVYFSGYHMNKNHWYTIILDGSVSIEELCHRIAESYLLAVKR